mmetsp:Transcript_12251/g.39199  ORF Transcript_12251/g.39199 Transcript_12251/m.39199 type:complete len:264 (+) Transcript_12251:173-964(+)
MPFMHACDSCPCTSVMATPILPKRPVRPTRCRYVSGLGRFPPLRRGTSKLITSCTATTSIPRASTSVASRMRVRWDRNRSNTRSRFSFSIVPMIMEVGSPRRLSSSWSHSTDLRRFKKMTTCPDVYALRNLYRISTLFISVLGCVSASSPSATRACGTPITNCFTVVKARSSFFTSSVLALGANCRANFSTCSSSVAEMSSSCTTLGRAAAWILALIILGSSFFFESAISSSASSNTSTLTARASNCRFCSKYLSVPEVPMMT